MGENEQDISEQIALFRFSVLGDLVHLKPGTPGIYGMYQERAAREWDIPGTLRTKIALETIRSWLSDYRRGGFDALRPKRRSDIGHLRRLPQYAADVLVAAKEENRDFTVAEVIAHVRDKGLVGADLALPYSTVHRLLQRHGLTKKLSPISTKDQRRFTFEKAGQLWMSDVMHGPSVLVGNRRRKTYLIAFIDDATRIIPHAAFALSENTQAFLPVLKTAIMRRGLPQRLFVDNGAAFRSKQLALVCAKLGITLVHARPYHAAAKGKIERWFRTVRMQLLRKLTQDDFKSIDAINRRLWAYVEGEYQQNPHRSLGNQTPADVWAQLADEVRYPDGDCDLDDLCLWEAKRKVRRDRTVSLNGVAYEVDAILVDQTVTLRYDPERPDKPIVVVHNGIAMHEAKPVDVHANCFVKRNPDEDGVRFADVEPNLEEIF